MVFDGEEGRSGLGDTSPLFLNFFFVTGAFFRFLGGDMDGAVFVFGSCSSLTRRNKARGTSMPSSTSPIP
jgi:hypothetical protein